MSDDMGGSEFDRVAGHRFFSADCFNRAWGLIEKPERTAEEDQEMLLLTLASLWHWTQREDCTPQNLSVGHWQASRVYTLLGDSQSAMRHAEHSLKYGGGEPPFYRAYAHEALARAAKLAGDDAAVQENLEKAFELAKHVADQEERVVLEKDLQTVSKVKAKLAVGNIVEVEVTNVANYGAFCRYEDQELLLMIVDISWIASFASCKQFADVGDELKVRVKSINYAQGKIAASIKDMYADPWEAGQLQVGAEFAGKVLRYVEAADRCNDMSGYLVEVLPGAYAMLCADGTTVDVGRECMVKIIEADPARHAVKLALAKMC